MNTQTPANANDARPMRAFQTDPSWYEDYWYGAQLPVTPGPVRRGLAALASFAPTVAWLRRLIAERWTEHTPVPEPQDAH
jgi:hypothetical protein